MKTFIITLFSVFAAVIAGAIVYLDWPKQEPAPAAQPHLLAVEQASFPRTSWSFAGYANPAASFESAMWACGSGNLNQFQASLSPDAQQKEQLQLQQMKPADLVHEFRNVTGFKITREELVSDDQVRLRFHADGVNADKDATLVKVGNDWKLDAIP